MKLEFALLAFPLLAIAALLILLPARSEPSGKAEKLNLRVSAAMPARDPEFARQTKLARAHIRFALSKLARSPQATSELTGSAHAATPVAAVRHEATRGAARPNVATPRRLAGARLMTRRSATVAAARRTRRRSSNWLALPRPLVWPAKTVAAAAEKAAASLGPVKSTVAGAVDRAGDAIEALRRKVL